MSDEDYHARLRAASGRRKAAVYRSLRKEDEEDSDEASSSGDEGEEQRPPALTAGKGCSATTIVLVLILGVVVLLGVAFVVLSRLRDSNNSSSAPSSSNSASSPTAANPADKTTPSSPSSASTPSSGQAGSPSSAPASATDSSDASSSSGTSSASSDQSALTEQGISTFLGNNTGGIASWYHTDSGTDSTNGRSWCEFPYNDAVVGFAPSLATMLSSFDNDATKAKTGFCGLEAEVYSPKTGALVTMIIADAFDDTWVKTPASIDVIYGSFPALFGSSTDNKNDVVKEVWWQLTGNRNESFTYKGVGVG
ncbi:hypothetical protein JCM8097_009583 [Rhodosporidiobolus ruineniae]